MGLEFLGHHHSGHGGIAVGGTEVCLGTQPGLTDLGSPPAVVGPVLACDFLCIIYCS